MPHCEICDSTDFKLIATEMREGPGRISQCSSCGLVIQELDFSLADIKKYYNEEYQKTNSLQTGKEQSPKEHFDGRLKTIGPFVECLRPYLRKGMKVLDIGCGAGDLLYSIKPLVGKVVGTELNKAFVEFMNNELDIEAYARDINEIDFGEEKFDLIISLGTLDHMPNPLESLQTMKSCLAPGGLLYLWVPNRDQAMNFFLPKETRKPFNTFFWHKAHFFYYTDITLARLLNKAGFSSEITSLHMYTLRNFFAWYFTGAPQNSFVEATTHAEFFSGESLFEKKMNDMFQNMESRFHAIMKETYRGDMLCCLAKPE